LFTKFIDYALLSIVSLQKLKHTYVERKAN